MKINYSGTDYDFDLEYKQHVILLKITTHRSFSLDFNYAHQLDILNPSQFRAIKKEYEDSLFNFINDMIEIKSIKTDFLSQREIPTATIEFNFGNIKRIETGIDILEYTEETFKFKFYAKLVLSRNPNKEETPEKIVNMVLTSKIMNKIHENFSQDTKYFMTRHIEMYSNIDKMLKDFNIDKKKVNRPVAFKATDY